MSILYKSFIHNVIYYSSQFHFMVLNYIRHEIKKIKKKLSYEF